MGAKTKGYSFGVETNVGPVAVITPATQESVVGAIVKMDGRASYDSDGYPSEELTYSWEFSRIPIGSQVELEGFTEIDADGSVVTFAPDVTGFYEVSLVVNDGSIDSSAVTASADVQILQVPNNEGLIPDASFIWNYISDFWNIVEDRERFEVLWSASIQIVAAELLKLYQYDYNKSIRDVQEVIQKRWIHYDSEVILDRLLVSGILADDQAGLEASTQAVDPDSGIVIDDQPDFFNLVMVPLTEGDFTTTSYGDTTAVGRLVTVLDRSYTYARSSLGLKAVNEGDDGSTTLGGDTFGGSGFIDSYVGFILWILSGSDEGQYLIDSVSVDGDSVDVTTLTGGAVSFNATASDINYSVVPTSNNVSVFFANRKVVPTWTAGQPWRFSSTIRTTEYDLEDLGVSIGDILEVEIERLDLKLTALTQFQIVGVDRGRISFVFNTDDLTDGTPAGGLSEAAQVALADALQVTGLAYNASNQLTYSLEAEVVYELINSIVFKREYYETTLTPETEIDLGAFSVKLRPTRIIRNSKLAIDADIESVPMLQEYIKQPNLGTVGDQLYVVARNDVLHEIDHEPYVFSENLDYVVDDESAIFGYANTTMNSDEVDIARGDLIDRGIRPGDTLELITGGTSVLYDIRKVIDSDTLRVFPIPSATAEVQFIIHRRIDGKFIRFINGKFTKDNPAPKRLWAEVTYFSNNPNIEANFGSLVGVKEEDLTARAVAAPYRSVVEGLMYARTNGPEQQNLLLAAQILLGLPFAENQGVIKEINPEYRIRPDGSPLYGRILIETRDDDGNPTGVTNVYLYPQGRQLEDPDDPTEWIPATPNESGLALNPSTGAEYAVGDSVEKFAVLSKGVEIDDYISDTTLTDTLVEQGNVAALVQQYHSFRMRINTDVTTPADIDFTTEYIKKVKPHYVHASAGLLKIMEDFVEIEENLFFGRFFEYFDTPCYSLPIAVKWDVGRGCDDYISVEGVMYSRYAYGTDLASTQGSNQLTSATGGFLYPASGQYFDTPLVRVGDLLAIESGGNAGEYPLASVVDDNNITITFSGTLETLTNQTFRIYRPITNPIFKPSVGVVVTTTSVDVGEGAFSAGVAVGDLLTFNGGSVNASRIYTIVGVDVVGEAVTVDPAVVEATGTYNGNIWRGGITREYWLNDETDTPFTANFTISNDAVVFQSGTSDLDQLSFLQPEDEIIDGSLVYNVLDFDPSNLTAYVTPLPPATVSGQSVKIRRPKRPAQPISLELLDRIPDEQVILDERLPTGNKDLLTTASSRNVSLNGTYDNFSTLGVVPGDFLVILEGADSSVDIGYGDGVYPILDVTSATTMTLTRALTTTQGAPGIRYGIQRRKSL